jgi:hypothetical protein
MSSSRTKCLSTKLTEAEYTTLEPAAGAQTLSAWARTVLLRAAAPAPPERVSGAYRDSRDRPDVPRIDDAGRGRLGLPTDDRVGPPAEYRVGPPANARIALAVDRPPYDPTVVVDWRPRSTYRSSWYSARTTNGTLTRAPAWLRDAGAGVPQCCGDRLLSVRPRLDASAAPVPLVLRLERRRDLPQRLVRSLGDRRPGGTPYGARRGRRPRGTDTGRRVVQPHADSPPPWGPRLAWQRSELDHAELHAWLRQWVYQDQTLRDLARPPLWGALAVLAAALVPVVSDEIAEAFIRRATRSARRR